MIFNKIQFAAFFATMAATAVNAGDPGYSPACAAAMGKESFHGYTCSNGMLFCYLEGSLGGVINVQADEAYKQDFLKLGGAIAATDSCCGDCEPIGCDANSGLYRINGCFINSGGKPDPFVGGQVGPFSDCWDELIANQVSFDTGPGALVNFVSSEYVVGNPVGVHQIALNFAGDRGSNC